MSDENVEREKAWSEFVSNNGLTYAAEQQLRVAFIGGWVRGRASRPREAGSGEDGLAQAAAACQSIALRYEAQAGEWNANAKAYAARECARAIHALRRGATHAQSHPSPGGGNAQVGGATERAAGIVPQAGSNVAPEACPCCGNTPHSPFKGAPPASATAEGGGEEIVAHTPLPRGLVLWQHETGRTMVMPEAKDPCFGWRRVTMPATPASVAGREGAVEKVVEAAKAWATSRVDHDASNVALLVAVDALLAAEAEGGDR